MPTGYLPHHPEQSFLLPPSVQEWLPEGHLAYYIDDTVDALDPSAFHARHEKGGPRNQPFHPAMMVEVSIHAHATGVFSSRKIERRLHEDVAFRVLGAGNFPKHRTLCDFRADHLEGLAALFVQVVQLARECGLVKLGTIVVDGTKIKADASRHEAMSHGRMREAEAALEQEIDALMKRAQDTDAAEEGEPESDVPAGIARREDRLAVIQAARERLSVRQAEVDRARGRTPDDDRLPRDGDGAPRRGARHEREFGVPEDRAQESFTDPDGRIMKRAGGGFDQSHDGHTAVDAEARIIVAAESSDGAADGDRLPVLLEAVEADLGALPQTVLADAGFRSEAVFERLAERPIDLVVAMGREGKKQLRIDEQKYPRTAEMAAKPRTESGKGAHRRRKAIVEPPNGWIKHILGFRQFSLRGLKKVSAEFKLVCSAPNLRRMSYLSMM